METLLSLLSQIWASHAVLIITAIKAVLVAVTLLQVVPLMVWLERRGSAVMQKRLGPNRIGPLGLFQGIADGVKALFKEDNPPAHVFKFYYRLAPVVSLIPAYMTFAVIPFASSIAIGEHTISFQVADLNVGFLYIFAIASLGVYGIIMAGWSSNNKYSLLGSLRSSAQMISYELSLGLSVVGLLMIFSSVRLGDIVRQQGELLVQLGPLSIPKWGIFIQPLGFLIFLVSAYAETNRLPFDLPEGESEIVAGYHLEYGSMHFALFMMAEYINMTVAAALTATLFFGGWQMLPGLPALQALLTQNLGLVGTLADLLRVLFELGSFVAKTAFFLWLFVWVRWTLPRFRYDQLMDLGWRVMLPLSLANIFVTGILIYYKVL
ncbi:MAG: NADH-quinone oxidoreductase subunit NuoH [Bdellovibrionales bacterium]|nr:NADH-quinone oxidoreductase subunit NuoH [Bdellovibrionales bacterium]